VLGAARQAFADYGFEEDEADLRSAILLSAGVGLLHAAGSTKDIPVELRERVLDFMLRP
jgi:hypothetical protein